MSLTIAIERSLAPLDQARRSWFRFVCKNRLAGSLLAHRERRLAMIVLLHALVASALAVHFPVALFVLGPIVLGVVHVLADVRYLVVRRPLPRWWRASVWVASGSLIALRAFAEAKLLRDSLRLEFAFATIFVLLAVVAAGEASSSSRRAAVAALGASVLGGAGLVWPFEARLVLLHGHNLIAWLILLVLFPARKRPLRAALLLVLALSVTLASGALYTISLRPLGATAFHLHVLQIADWVAPGLPADLAIGVTTAYVFLQSAHYLTWLVLIPQRDQKAESTASFRTSFRSLVRDFGPLRLALGVALAALVMLGAAFDAPRTQRVYLSLGMFHVYLELAMFVYFWVRKRTEP